MADHQVDISLCERYKRSPFRKASSYHIIPAYVIVTVVFAIRYSVIPAATAAIAEFALPLLNDVPSVPIAAFIFDMIADANADLLMFHLPLNHNAERH